MLFAVLQVFVPFTGIPVCAADENSVRFDPYDEVIYPYHDGVKNYLSEYPDANVADYIPEVNIDQHKDNTVTWQYDGTGLNGYTFELARSYDFSDAKVYRLAPDENSFTFANLLKSQKYYMRVTAETDTGSYTDTGSFSTTSLGPRILNVGGRYWNFRDMGGYVTLDGYTVRQNRIIRGSSIDNSSEIDSCLLTEEGYKYLNDELAVKLEIDFRKDNENCGRTYSSLANADYVQIPLNQYDFAFSSEHMALYREVFQKFADESNYPVYFHCAAGADRTGTVAIMLLALLNVSYNEIMEDYELTSFSKVGLRDYSMIKSTLDAFGRFGGSTLHEQVKNYLLAIGITEKEIEQIKTNMLEDYTSDYKEDSSVCRIIFNGVLNAKDVPDSMTVKKGKQVLLPDSLPTFEGWAFIGWNESGNGAYPYYTPGMPVTVNQNTQLKAIWSRADENGKFEKNGFYSLYYSANGGSWDDAGSVYRRSSVHFGTIQNGMEYTFPDDVSSLHRDGYRLHTADDLNTVLFYSAKGDDGSEKENNGYGTAIKQGVSKFTVTADDAPYGTNQFVYACWDPVILYDMNTANNTTAADFRIATEAGGYRILGPGEKTKYALSDKNREGYAGPRLIPNNGQLIGWNTQRDGSGASYEIGKVYEITQPLTLYAQYQTGNGEFDDSPDNPFSDILANSWYTEAALWCNKNGYITGTSATVFNPNGRLTRAMFVQILSKADGVDLSKVTYKGRFADVKAGNWFANSVQWAADCGITGGTGAGTFSPNNSVTREQLASFFFAYAKYKKYDTGAAVPLDKYTDISTAGKWALGALQWAVAEGLISGTGDTMVSPKASATRAQAAVIFRNFVENYVAGQKK